ncbi:hypothetical protein [Acinetobacter sp.]|uniref:hypothetical protein n=1 Tax=Acinetobacter sp. TaxID=472 RepID=UPI0028A59F25|nr:hypothetical protein [Acinetobacter sp.]
MVIKVLARKRPAVVFVYWVMDIYDCMRHPIQSLKYLKKRIRHAKNNNVLPDLGATNV